MYFDSHAHLDDGRFDADRAEIFADLPRRGVGLLMNVGYDLPSSERSVALAHAYDFVYAAVGSHPDDAASVDGRLLDRYRALAADPRVRAIGEIGLDYYWAENPPRELQQDVLRRQMALAQELSLPVIIHDRDAHADTMAIVREFPRVTGVFHCFAGSVEMAWELLALGWMLSFNGAITFKNARRAPEVVAAVPLERLMIETDSPYLSPVPLRGKRNDSRNLTYVLETLAAWKGVTPEEMARITLENGKRLYRLE